ncbi:GNAT family N-acetyltransferase [Paenibacillus sp. KQZ6P-2]|uniref:GNAT family N-acetyltransferase n=1 Tax=Paenibacillus mangrovi TaxID=2931978 RepID=A0A9X1WNC3_9BACL|nr:GNAT family N-acetyltransferase [Paenibacillus mangrovi]MCJ8010753.1 GNAT family N-acetyltransferase [Paenibacillus mangrovi]
MKVELKPPTFEEKEILKNLLEHYLYELSCYSDQIDINKIGQYGYRYLDHYWTDEDRHAFLILLEDKLVGLAMVRKFDYSGNSKDYRWLMSEFFILRKYQNQGIGRMAAHQLFNLFSGPWIVAQMENNIPSRRFWEKVIFEFTNGEYQQSKLGKQPAQEFVSKENVTGKESRYII